MVRGLYTSSLRRNLRLRNSCMPCLMLATRVCSQPSIRAIGAAPESPSRYVFCKVKREMQKGNYTPSELARMAMRCLDALELPFGCLMCKRQAEVMSPPRNSDPCSPCSLPVERSTCQTFQSPTSHLLSWTDLTFSPTSSAVAHSSSTQEVASPNASLQNHSITIPVATGC